MAPLFLVLFLISSCAWWQKHAPQIDCTIHATVRDLPDLVAGIEGCARAAGNISACLESLVDPVKNWSRDVIACWARRMASEIGAKAQAGNHLDARETKIHERLRGWIAEEGLTFK